MALYTVQSPSSSPSASYPAAFSARIVAWPWQQAIEAEIRILKALLCRRMWHNDAQWSLKLLLQFQSVRARRWYGKLTFCQHSVSSTWKLIAGLAIYFFKRMWHFPVQGNDYYMSSRRQPPILVDTKSVLIVFIIDGALFLFQLLFDLQFSSRRWLSMYYWRLSVSVWL